MTIYPVNQCGYPMITLSTEQAVKSLNTSEETLKLLREFGCLKGMRLGKKFSYSIIEIEEFLNLYRGCDMSNRYTIAAAVKERGLPGGNRKAQR